METKPVRQEKIIQFGEGGFLRGFVDWIVQLVDEASDFNASVVVVQPIARGMCAKLEAQNCVYTHVMRGLRNGVPTVEKKRIDVISRTVEPYRDFEAYLALAENPGFRFVVSNTTEAGIVFRREDRPEAAPEISFPAKVTLLLKRRFDLGLPGFVFLPCELIDRNGQALKQAVLEYSDLWGLGEAFAGWVEAENCFCNTLVDRIVTGYPGAEAEALEPGDPMLDTSELFHFWAIQGPAWLKEEFPFEKAGLNILLTQDLEQYRARKVRILNGAHTAMVPYALLKGLETVGDCMEDAAMRAFAEACVYEEIIPTLDLPREELTAYADSVFQRFRNPYIRHRCASIALNSVSKFRVRVLPSILEYRRRTGSLPPHLMTAFAKLLQFYREGTPNDAPEVVQAMQSRDTRAILANADLWGMDLSFLAEALG